MKRFLFPTTSALALLSALLTGCSVYAPMQPTASGIRAQGQAEISGSIQPTGRVEGGITYSPRPHLLVSGAGTFRPKTGDTRYMATQQLELGVGTYWTLGSHLVVTGLGGAGLGSSQKGFVEVPVPLVSDGPRYARYEARYGKAFGQLGLHYDFRGGAIGAAYRLTGVGFSHLTYSDTHTALAIPLRHMVRHEPMLYGRLDLSRAQPQRWQLQGTVGMSVTPGFRSSDTYEVGTYEANRTRLPSLYTSLGVVFRPSWGISR